MMDQLLQQGFLPLNTPVEKIGTFALILRRQLSVSDILPVPASSNLSSLVFLSSEPESQLFRYKSRELSSPMLACTFHPPLLFSSLPFLFLSKLRSVQRWPLAKSQVSEIQERFVLPPSFSLLFSSTPPCAHFIPCFLNRIPRCKRLGRVALHPRRCQYFLFNLLIIFLTFIFFFFSCFSLVPVIFVLRGTFCTSSTL